MTRMRSLVETVAEPGTAPGEADYVVEVLHGSRAAMAAGPEIAELRVRAGQDDNPLLGLDFFLARVRLFPGNQPVVVLVRSDERLEGVVFLYEKTFCGVRTGYLRCFDHLTGESSVIAPDHIRAKILRVAIHQLVVKTSARVAWATLSQGAAKFVESMAVESPQQVKAGSICREHRIKLGETFASTLSRFGAHTRRNLRYYRRRAESELNAAYDPDLSFAESDEALRQLSDHSFQPFSGSIAEWRKMEQLLRAQPGYFAMGLHAGGEWLSYLAGLRSGNFTYVLMQINHTGFARYSLSTVLRSYFFEHEIGRGQEEIKFVNGTCAYFQRCCEPDTCVTVSAHRGITAFVIFRWIAPWYSAPDHALNMQRWTADQPKG